MNKHKKQLLIMLKGMSKAMEVVQEIPDATLAMEMFSDAKGVGHCGTAACVLGHYAIYKGYEGHTASEMAVNLADDLDYICYLFLGTDDMANSIWASEAWEREESASFSGLFTDKEVENIPHLNKPDPTAKEAKEYIDLCIKKIKEYDDVRTK